MNNLVGKLFPEGQRKLIVSLIALAVGIIFEKTQGGLSQNMEDALIAIVAIFTGGNVMEHITNAMKVLKGTKVGGIIEDIMPGDQGLGPDPAPAPVVQEQPVVEQQEIDYNEARFQDIEQKLQIQAQNTAHIVNLLNKMTAQQQPQQPPRG